MPRTDSPLAQPGDIADALRLLSRIPAGHGPTRGAAAAWAYPLAGLAIGAVAGAVAWLAMALGLSAPLAALLVLASAVMLTGALHEDGLADTADGLWGGATAARRLEIMKDSHIGTYGVIALILSLGARWGALWLLLETGTWAAIAAILCAAALSRAALPVLMWGLPNARRSGLSHSVGAVAANTALLAVVIAAALALLLVGGGAFGAIFWGGVTVVGLGWIARTTIGGQTGDILGAAQQLCEIAVLFSILT